MYVQVPAALDQAKGMVSEGAAIVDVGGQSTRPGAQLLSAEAELQRVLPVIRWNKFPCAPRWDADASSKPRALDDVCPARHV